MPSYKERVRKGLLNKQSHDYHYAFSANTARFNCARKENTCGQVYCNQSTLHIVMAKFGQVTACMQEHAAYDFATIKEYARRPPDSEKAKLHQMLGGPGFWTHKFDGTKLHA